MAHFIRTSQRVLIRWACLLPLLLFSGKAFSYGVLTHQAIIDATWKPALLPLLQKRFPQSTQEDLKEAYAYAYGGAIIQDMGYFPFGNTFFTDLTHYTRSGDFVEALFSEATNENEFAFALGALAHYYADNFGHPIGTNQAVAMVYPELKPKYGPVITYEEDPAAHIKTEFGFDVLQVARGNYAPEAYHDFIGFEVSKEQLERAFKKTYGIELKSLFLNLDLSIGTFRRSVSTLIPKLTKAAWNVKAHEIKSAQPSQTRRNFVFRLKNTAYHQKWGREYQKPGFFERILGWILKLLPKIGPNEALAFIPPTPAAEKVFMESFNVTSQKYNQALKKLLQDSVHLKNTALDTGDPSQLGKYEKADETYAELLERLGKDNFVNVPAPLKKDILNYYAKAPDRAPKEEEDKKEWAKTQDLLKKLKEGITP